MPLTKEQYNNYQAREELRQDYLDNRMTTTNTKIVSSQENWSKEDPLNKARHKVSCNWFHECNFCFKCDHYNPNLEKCRQCPLVKADGICYKKEIHTEKAKGMLIKRPKIIIRKEDSNGKEN